MDVWLTGRSRRPADHRRDLGSRWPRLRDPAFRAALLAEAFEGGRREQRVQRWDRMFPLGDPPNYEPDPSESVANRANTAWSARPRHT